jgi:hypothetical protein
VTVIMAELAQEEADYFLSQKEHHSAHPEDRVDVESPSSEPPPFTENHNLPDTGDDEDTLNDMMYPSSSMANYRLPTTLFDANTGPKGVIADAQSFNRAKKYSIRKTLQAFTSNAQSAFSRPSFPRKASPVGNENGDSSSSEFEGSDEDDDFMRQWRENRLKELASGATITQRRQSPSKRLWGRFDDVDANGYLDAVEKVPHDTVVVVCIYDPEVLPPHLLSHHHHSIFLPTDPCPQSTASSAVEDSLTTLAQKHVTIRFVKLHHEIAEMENVGVPAILAYRAGDVFATIPDARPEGLETLLRRYVGSPPVLLTYGRSVPC